MREQKTFMEVKASHTKAAAYIETRGQEKLKATASGGALLTLLTGHDALKSRRH